MEQRFEELREELVLRLNTLQGRLDRIRGDRHQERGPLNRDLAEQAIELENAEVLDALDDSGLMELRAIRAALVRLDNDEYGSCAKCGDPIPLERLRALPETPFCLRCAA